MENKKEKEEKFIQIGELAKKTKVTPRTIKHYEEKGLLRPFKKTKGGFRLYQNDKVELVKRIRQLKKAGFSLSEVKEMEEINGVVEEENILEKVDVNELDKMITFLQFQLEKTEERLEETIKVKKGLEDIIGFLEKRRQVNSKT
ncbi:MAG: MerR family transcriptional regulator [Atribacterota bacterium]|nr:MerR family transcriptional regulator [Atribacterota bacterium]